ncbi:MAG: endolytic transglycosylase MltG [Candidatus Peregrinibacteria bacterium]
MKRSFIIAGIVVVFLLLLRSCSAKPDESINIFTVNRNTVSSMTKEKLLQQKWMQGHWFFGLSMLVHGGYARIRPGAYRIADSMSSWTIAGVLTADPPLHWVIIPEGLRKEQVADRLAAALGWDQMKRDAFLVVPIQRPYDLADGFYFPDTYLIPTDETVTQVANRFMNRFNENFAPYVEGFRKANIKADTALKIASIIQKEAGGQNDMPLIAGILWNRLLIKMPLEIDATLQYARGDTGSGYWAPITPAAKAIDSPFNTYKFKGLPPSPISNPGLDAIDAVLHSTETQCLFYLHDHNRNIHCAETYAEHLNNIDTYLRNQG